MGFNQPARHARRHLNRVVKLKKIAPRPLGLLRPQVRGCTIKHNMKWKVGRGFTHEELKAVGIPRKFARTIGIAVDWRRQNHCEETYSENVKRLKTYQRKLILFPRNPKKIKKGESSKKRMRSSSSTCLA